MRLVSFQADDGQRYGVVLEGDLVLDLPAASGHAGAPACPAPVPTSLLEGIAMGPPFMDWVNRMQQWVQGLGGEPKSRLLRPLVDLELLAPIPRPAKNIFCVGKNYRDHAMEIGGPGAVPDHVVMFSKAPTSVNRPEGVIRRHAHLTSRIDYEGELAVVMGKKGFRIPPEEAMSYIFGYTILNDVTARDLQARHQQYLLGKSLDSFCPMGPVLVTRDEIPDPHNLRIETRVNGEVRQSARTSEMIFRIPEVISTLSAGITLEPGDIIATGTPAGVGMGMDPPRFLQPNDVVEVEIEGIGVLRNYIEE